MPVPPRKCIVGRCAVSTIAPASLASDFVAELLYRPPPNRGRWHSFNHDLADGLLSEVLELLRAREVPAQSSGVKPHRARKHVFEMSTLIRLIALLTEPPFRGPHPRRVLLLTRRRLAPGVGGRPHHPNPRLAVVGIRRRPPPAVDSRWCSTLASQQGLIRYGPTARKADRAVPVQPRRCPAPALVLGATASAVLNLSRCPGGGRRRSLPGWSGSAGRGRPRASEAEDTPPQTFEELVQRAEQGNATAQFNPGRAYGKGEGVPRQRRAVHGRACAVRAGLPSLGSHPKRDHRPKEGPAENRVIE